MQVRVAEHTRPDAPASEPAPTDAYGRALVLSLLTTHLQALRGYWRIEVGFVTVGTVLRCGWPTDPGQRKAILALLPSLLTSAPARGGDVSIIEGGSLGRDSTTIAWPELDG